LPSSDLTEFDQFPAKPRFQVLVLRLLTMAANAENAEIAHMVIGAHSIDVMDVKQMAVFMFRQIHTAFLAAPVGTGFMLTRDSLPIIGVAVGKRCFSRTGGRAPE
jgi:hypothetical protein